MQSHAFKILWALILLNTTICLAMLKSGGNEPHRIGIASVICENRVYNKLQISLAIKAGLRSFALMEETNMDLDVVQYTPQPTEAMPSNKKFYFSALQKLGRNGPTDLVVFSRNGLFAKVVTRVLDSQGFKYVECVPSQTMPLPQELQPVWGFPGQNNGEHDPFGIGTTSVSCEGRVYIKQEISMAIINGMRSIAKLNEFQMDPDVIQYIPKPMEVMPPSQEKFYFSELKKLGPNGPVDMVVFLPSGQFAKVVVQRDDGGEPYHIDCISSSYKESPEGSPSRMESPEPPQLRLGSPERSQMRMASSKRRRLRSGSFKRRRLNMKSPEQESFNYKGT